MFQHTKAFNTICIKSNSYYENSPNYIQTLVSLRNRQFGCVIEKITKELLHMDEPSDSSHDAKLFNFKFEIKSSRFWTTLKDFKWQHIEPLHYFDYIIFVALTQTDLKVYFLDYKSVMFLISINKITKQGGGNGQGFWCQFRHIKEYLSEITF